jgi:uncharacterized RDD family membrane protein YckC
MWVLVLSMAAALVLRNAMKFSYAGLWRRSLAFALDYLVIAAYLALLGLVSILVNTTAPTLGAAFFANRLSDHITAFLLVSLPVTLYFALLEASSWQATWGKRKLDLRVVRNDGARLSTGRALGRTVLAFIPWELAHTLIWQIRFAPATPLPLITGGFVLVWVLVGANVARLAVPKTHQSLADWLAGTYVIEQSSTTA